MTDRPPSVAHEQVFLDLADPALDTTSALVHDARAQDWLAPTSYGFAVLRFDAASELLADRRFRQGNARWPEQNGVTEGPFLEWWQRVLLSLEGDDHARLRRLLLPAFKRQAILRLQPRFQEIAAGLIAGFAGRGEVELISEFAEPYSARILCLLLGLPEEEWERVAHWADDLGRSFGIGVADDVPVIEAALEGLTAYVAAAVDARAADPRDDLVSDLVRAQVADGQLTRDELLVSLVFLAFAGDGDHAQPDRPGGADPAAPPRPVAAARRAPRPRRGGGRGGHAGQPDGHLGHPRGRRGRRLPRRPLPGRLDPAGALARRGHRPRRDGRDRLRPHPRPRAAAAPRVREGRAPLPRPLRRPHRHGRRPADAGPGDAHAEPDGPGEWLPVSGNTGAVSFPIRFTPR